MQMVIDHSNRNNDALGSLLEKVSEVYALLTEKQGLAKRPFMPEMYGKTARQILECADFIVHYSETICESTVLRGCRGLNVVSLHRETPWQGRIGLRHSELH